MSSPLLTPFEAALSAIRKEGRARVFTPLERKMGSFPEAVWTMPDGRKKNITIWCGNDYLGMGQNPVVLAAMQNALSTYGTGAGGTRNISGSSPLHNALEETLAELHEKEAAIVFNSGYLANASTLATLARILPNPVFYSDAKNHASMIEGIRHTRTEKHIFHHNDPQHLDELLSEAPKDATKIVVFESVYSMDGTIAPLAALLDVAEKHGAFTYLDEVHAVGLYGEKGGGIAQRDNALSRLHIVQGTLGKAFGLIGGYITGARVVVEALRAMTPGFIFTTSIPPVIAAGAVASVRYVMEHAALRAQHGQAIEATKQALRGAGLPLIPSPSHILPLAIGDAARAKMFSDTLLYEYGVYLQPINYPTVPRGQERFRITPTPLHTPVHIGALTTALLDVFSGTAFAQAAG